MLWLFDYQSLVSKVQTSAMDYQAVLGTNAVSKHMLGLAESKKTEAEEEILEWLTNHPIPSDFEDQMKVKKQIDVKYDTYLFGCALDCSMPWPWHSLANARKIKGKTV